MIVVWDNGWTYSGHEICFVDIGVGAQAEEHLALMRRTAHGSGYVVCTAPTVSWYVGEPMPWEIWVSEVAPHEVTCGWQSAFHTNPCTCWIGLTGLAKLRVPQRKREP